jgi:5-hydroxyisourate hydrolase
MTDGPTISTHVLDLESGRPAAGITIDLVRAWDEKRIGGGVTDYDGRIRNLLEGEPLEATDYQLRFTLSGPFFKHAAVTFHVDDPMRSYHVPLLMAPYGLTTYRGS